LPDTRSQRVIVLAHPTKRLAYHGRQTEPSLGLAPWKGTSRNAGIGRNIHRGIRFTAMNR